MKKIWIGVIILVTAIAIILLVTLIPKQSNEIKIGAIFPLTGSAAQFGEWKKQGIDLAVNEINEAGGINGKQIKIYYEDSQGDPKIAISALRKLMTVEKVKIIFSDMSGVTLSLLPITKKEILVITSATHPEITSGKYLAIRNYVTPAQEAAEMAYFARDKLGYDKVAILYWNDEAMRAYNQYFIDSFSKVGGKTHSESYESGINDFRSQLTKIKRWEPQAIYIAGWKEVGSIMKQARELGIKSVFLGTITFESPAMISLSGNSSEGAFYTVPAFSGPYQNTESAMFVSKYKEIYGVEPEAITAIWYDMMYVLSDAIKNNRSDEPLKIYNAITSKESCSGVMGKFSFDPEGNIRMKIGFKRITNGNFLWYVN